MSYTWVGHLNTDAHGLVRRSTTPSQVTCNDACAWVDTNDELPTPRPQYRILRCGLVIVSDPFPYCESGIDGQGGVETERLLNKSMSLNDPDTSTLSQYFRA